MGDHLSPEPTFQEQIENYMQELDGFTRVEPGEDACAAPGIMLSAISKIDDVKNLIATRIEGLTVEEASALRDLRGWHADHESVEFGHLIDQHGIEVLRSMNEIIGAEKMVTTMDEMIDTGFNGELPSVAELTSLVEERFDVTCPARVTP